jgi:hypothetical protein
MKHRNNLLALVCALVFVLVSCLGPVGIDPSGRVNRTVHTNYTFTPTPLPPIKTAAQWGIQVKRLNLLAKAWANQQAAALAAGEGGILPASLDSPESENEEEEAVAIATSYILLIDMNADITLPPSGELYNPVLEADGFTILVRGAGKEDGKTPRLKLGSAGKLLNIEENQTVILENLKLEGIGGNIAPLVQVTGSSLELGEGAELTGNENTAGAGGCLSFDGGSLLVRQGAKITGNTASGGNGKGGGIYALNNAALTIEGIVGGEQPGEGNSASAEGGGIYLSGGATIALEAGSGITGNTAGNGGGGIYFNGGTHAIGAGVKICGNNTSGASGKGGGVYANNAALTLTGVIGGELPGEGNSAGAEGGGIYLSGSTVTLGNGSGITGNTAGNGGGGIYYNGGTHTIGTGVKISGNSANGTSGRGGGVYANNAALTLTGIIGGTSSGDGNSAYVQGGGVYMSGGSLTMQSSAAISWNSINSPYFGGYEYSGGGVFGGGGTVITMNGTSAVSDNTSTHWGGGIALRGGSRLVMNESSAVKRNRADTWGGGVLCDEYATAANACTITMNGNSVIGGFQQSDGNIGWGGGVVLRNGPHSLVMKDNAAISYNTSHGDGGGVLAGGGSAANAKVTVTMQGNSVIRNNIAGINGGGIIITAAILTMEGNSKIGGASGQGNTSSGLGGGIHFAYSSDAVLSIPGSGAKVSYNHAGTKGGGVCVYTYSGGTNFTGNDKVTNNTKGSGTASNSEAHDPRNP